MPRPPRCRRICSEPLIDCFCPRGAENGEPIRLTLDEYEVIRLVDLEQQTHEQCAGQEHSRCGRCCRMQNLDTIQTFSAATTTMNTAKAATPAAATAVETMAATNRIFLMLPDL